jgi:hypothetical protein
MLKHSTAVYDHLQNADMRNRSWSFFVAATQNAAPSEHFLVRFRTPFLPCETAPGRRTQRAVATFLCMRKCFVQLQTPISAVFKLHQRLKLGEHLREV